MQKAEPPRDETHAERAQREQDEKTPPGPVLVVDDDAPDPIQLAKERGMQQHEALRRNEQPRSPYQKSWRGRGNRHPGEGLAAMMERLARRPV